MYFNILQVVLSQLTLAPESDSFVRDEEGSGSGHPPVTQWIDDGEPEDPSWPDEGSASGDNPLPPGSATLLVLLHLSILTVQLIKKL
jgi:hypothetical protein